METVINKKRDYTLSSVRNALRIMHCFSMDEPELKLTDISKRLNLGKSTVSRMMATLQQEGFIEKNPDNQRFRLGLSILSLASVCTSTYDIHQEAGPVLHELTERTQETSHLAILDQHEVIYLQKVESKHQVRAFTHIGKRNPAYCTSSGKILLAYHDHEERLLQAVEGDGFVAHTKNTITTVDELRDELRDVRAKGYAISLEELSEGVATIAAPIRDYTGKVIASVNLIGPVQRVNQYTIHTHTRRVVDAGKQISRKLGFRQ
ncbi:transcriptional regulator, IclR family [Geomicrobium sp. JCM 19037]|uniref:IclR family transcriptional regulator n=1 Tax=unclassified Geomicrobium TaxID=2628951 RepID=UPI00045F15FF|nr:MULTISPECIES: IclR family transcriptional regulator [unclassified Geomicrobium]GAK05537.1 transcriptional regulator, IclR family [Geomicrobium sp. JCM 19037]GAK14253.1 transcriptional regulator, IclR family [Geomicrobium sp. JCM 19039]